MTEAIGQPEVLRERCKRLAAKEWAGKAVKMRAKDKDGRAGEGGGGGDGDGPLAINSGNKAA